MASSFRQNLPTIVASFSAVPLATGLYGAASPLEAMKAAFGWQPSPTASSADRRLAATLMRLQSIRSIGFAIGGIAVWYTGDRRVQGWTMLSGMLIALGDGFAAYEYTGKLADGVGHWFAIPIALGFGSALLGWI